MKTEQTNIENRNYFFGPVEVLEGIYGYIKEGKNKVLTMSLSENLIKYNNENQK